MAKPPTGTDPNEFPASSPVGVTHFTPQREMRPKTSAPNGNSSDEIGASRWLVTTLTIDLPNNIAYASGPYYTNLVNRLLTALSGLSAVDRDLLERELSAAVEYARETGNIDRLIAKMIEINSPTQATPQGLPASAPSLFVDAKRADPKLKASAFLIDVWGEYIKSKTLYLYQLRGLDPKLVEALDNEFRGRRAELLALIPTKYEETHRLLAERPNVPSSASGKRALAAQLRKPGPPLN